MAAGLSVTQALVELPDLESFTNVRVLVRNNHVTLRDSLSQVVKEGDVTRVSRSGRSVWKLTMIDGSEWTVTQVGRRCCGGG